MVSNIDHALAPCPVCGEEPSAHTTPDDWSYHCTYCEVDTPTEVGILRTRLQAAEARAEKAEGEVHKLAGATAKVVAMFRYHGCPDTDDPGLWLGRIIAENARLWEALKECVKYMEPKANGEPGAAERNARAALSPTPESETPGPSADEDKWTCPGCGHRSWGRPNLPDGQLNSYGGGVQDFSRRRCHVCNLVSPETP